ncbi:hypothetical protein [Nocardia sp. NBC_01388]|uniref:hypothetical protein n=1 Tax=Nocardia sp. NBC_01388 TaxID=2903596 RepID=UPI003244C148
MPEQLSFTGSISGELDRAVAVAAVATSDPLPKLRQGGGQPIDLMPTRTQCAEFMPDIGIGPDREIRYDYLATIVGDVAAHRVALVVRLGHGVVKVQPTEVRSGWLELFIEGQEAAPRQQLPPISITLDADRKGGTVDGWLGPGEPGTTTATHIAGQWKCG